MKISMWTWMGSLIALLIVESVLSENVNRAYGGVSSSNLKRWGKIRAPYSNSGGAEEARIRLREIENSLRTLDENSISSRTGWGSTDYEDTLESAYKVLEMITNYKKTVYFSEGTKCHKGSKDRRLLIILTSIVREVEYLTYNLRPSCKDEDEVTAVRDVYVYLRDRYQTVGPIIRDGSGWSSDNPKFYESPSYNIHNHYWNPVGRWSGRDKIQVLESIDDPYKHKGRQDIEEHYGW